MARTSKQIQGDIYRLLAGSTFSTMISGGVYRQGCRPRDSRKEDAVVTFTTGTAGQIQEGVVTVNIYVPDIDPCCNGVLVEDGERLEEVERLAQEWVDDIAANVAEYDFELRQAIYAQAEEETAQHFVVVKLGYKLCELEN